MCILSPDLPHASHAASLSGPVRQQLALDALAGVPVSRIAADELVSRKFVYQQLHLAQDALTNAFAPSSTDPPGLLYWLPVTKSWLDQLVLAELLENLSGDFPGTCCRIDLDAKPASQLGRRLPRAQRRRRDVRSKPLCRSRPRRLTQREPPER